MATNNSDLQDQRLTALLNEQHGTTGLALPDAPDGPILPARGATTLMALIAAALDDGLGITGAELRDGLADIGFSGSAGTSYDRLHELEADGMLAAEHLSHSIRYRVADPEAAQETLAGYERRLRWLADLAHEAQVELDHE